MDEQANEYIELYPIYKALCQKIEREILNSENKKIIRVDKGNTLLVDETFGKIELIPDISYVRIIYPLLSSKYKEELKKSIIELYSEYYGVTILEEPVRTTHIDVLRKACNLVVVIPCDLNKIHYHKLGIVEKQKLREEAVQNVTSGLIVFEPEDKMNRR